MKEETRRAIAFMAVARLKEAGQVTGGHVYSYAEGAHTAVGGNKRSAYDYGVGAHITSGGADSDNMYHYGTGSHIQLKMSGNRFSGYDYDTGSHYSGSVNGRSVSLYDYGDGRWYNFVV